MDQLSNSFSLLEVNIEDAREQTAADDCETRDGGNGEGNCSGGGTVVNDENGDAKTSEMTLQALEKPLVWIDLEMTGLDIEVDRILEIACVITDGNLTRSVQGPDLVIHQPKECLDKMGEWCQEHHLASGCRVCQETCGYTYTSYCGKFDLH